MSIFALTKVGPGVREGPATGCVFINVCSDDNNAAKIFRASYPDGKELNPDPNGKFSFEIIDDGDEHTVDVQISPPTIPDDWQIVEVGQDGHDERSSDSKSVPNPNGLVRLLSEFP
jgi:hypothetical protein